MTELSVNLNKIALLRNARTIGIPSVIRAACIVLDAGAYGVTVHPRPDERHIRYSDVYELRKLLDDKYPDKEFNIEGNPFCGRYMEVVKEVTPDQATLVPDDPSAPTSDHGWDLVENHEKLRPVIDELNSHGIRVSLFMDPVTENLEIAKEIGAKRIELYTEPYATSFRKDKDLENMLYKYKKSAEKALEVGLELNAGHDLNLKNTGKFCKEVPGILEVSIGHALTAEALEIGLADTVKEYLKILA